MSASTPDVVVIGRVGADLYPLQSETPLSEVRDFRRFVGGFAANVATGLARLDVRTAIVSAVGADGNGEFIRRSLEGDQVDTRWLSTDPVWRTPLSFCELWPPDDFPITYYRQPTAPDWEIAVDEQMLESTAAASLLMVSGTGLARPHSRTLTSSAMKRCGGITLLDLDYRPSLWESANDYAEVISSAVRDADIVIGNESEVSGSGITPENIIASGKTLILKQGPKGVTAYTSDDEIYAPGNPVPVVNGLGAGDAFLAAFGYGLINGDDIRSNVKRANHAGAIVSGRLACAAAMPTLEELAGQTTAP